MKTHWFAAGLALVSTLCLGGCPQAPAPADEDAAGQVVEEIGAAVEAGGGGATILAGTVTARFGASPETTMIASECAITNGGANGVIRADDGAFDLSWADGTYRLVWNHADGRYQGEVTGSVIEGGGGMSFEGSANGQAAQGFAVCTSGM
jgi:hypothetical protein